MRVTAASAAVVALALHCRDGSTQSLGSLCSLGTGAGERGFRLTQFYGLEVVETPTQSIGSPAGKFTGSARGRANPMPARRRIELGRRVRRAGWRYPTLRGR
jgi:hypothetical protein